MPQAVQISIPAYLPDSTAGITVAGYQVQGSSASGASGIPTGWTDLPGSPFTSNLNILDTSDDASVTKLYRAKPVLQVTSNSTVYTLDAPWSRAFLPTETLYDATFSAQLIPILRATYLADSGTPQTNGTKMLEATGPGQGVWTPDGATNRFSLQYVENDDPVRVLDSWYKLTWTDNTGTPKSAVPDQDYRVDIYNGVVEFATFPDATDYLRFDFRKCDFVNADLYASLQSAIAALSQYGINGYQLNQSNNLLTMNKPLANPDLGDLVCKIAVRNIRDGLTELALRHDAGWRDGSNQYDPQPNRNLQFTVQKLDLSDSLIRMLANGWIRSNTAIRARGDFDAMFDMSAMSPVTLGMFQQFSAFSGWGVGFGMGTGFWNPWYL